MTMTNLSAPVLGQLLLMQSVLASLPDEPAIRSFVCRGLSDLPGVRAVEWCAEPGQTADETSACFPLLVGNSRKGELLLRLADRAAFLPYEPYLKNFSFMLAVILEERQQRRLAQAHQGELEKRVEERTAELTRRINESANARRALLDTLEDQTRAEAALRASERKFRALTQQMPDLVWEKDAASVYVSCNKHYADTLGLTPETMAGHRDEDFYPAELAAKYRADDRQVIASGQPLKTEEQWQQGAERRWLHTHKAPLLDEQGRCVGTIGIGRDITARKQAEAALRESEERFRKIFEEGPMGMAIASLADGRFARANAAFCAMLGYTEEALQRLTFLEVTHPDHRATDWEAVKGLREGTIQQHQAEKRYLRQNGEVIWGALALTRFASADGQSFYALAMIQDITERKRLEQERAAMEAQLRQQQKLESIGTLASGVAHEINNPLNGAMNYAQLILDQSVPDSPTAEFAREILHETERVAVIVRNLLRFARDEKQSHSPARLTDIVEGTLSLIRTVMRHDQITLRVDLPEDLPELRCRSQQLQQVLMNLMTNARDALNARYPGHDPDKVLHVTAREFAKEGRRWIRVTVEDHGTGITPAVRERMFDPFYTTKPRDLGTGMGLSISHGIVKDHHGELTVETEPGHFTRMHLDLPVDNGWNL